MDQKLIQKIQELVREEIEIVSYNSSWPLLFEKEKSYLKELIPEGHITRIEHFGSTAVPGLSAKPIIDILVEVRSLDKKIIVPILESKGYE